MATTIHDPIGRHLKFRDLQIFSTVVEGGSMAEAARRLGLTQPAVSEVIAQIEQALGVRLFDRNTKGVKLTVYGLAFLKRAQAASDEMRQCAKDIAFLTDPTAGEIQIGCAPRLSAAILPHIVERFSRAYPRVALHIEEIPPLTPELSGLRDRQHDLMIGRLVAPLGENAFGDDVNVDTLFADRLVIAAGNDSRWARRRKIDLAELTDEPWVLTSADTWDHLGVSEAFRARGVPMPKARLFTSSVSIVSHLLAKGEFLTATSELIAESMAFKVLPIDLRLGSWPAVIVTLKNRALSPVAERFIECSHRVVESLVR